MPNATIEIWNQLGLSGSLDSPETPAGIDPAKLKWGELAEGTNIREVKPLFPRIDRAKTMKEINEGVQSPTSNVQSPANTGTAGVRGPRPGSPAGVLDPPAMSAAGANYAGRKNEETT